MNMRDELEFDDCFPVNLNPNKSLSIKTVTCNTHFRTSADNQQQKSPHVEELAALNSPSLISPPSSAFASALQSPYISPRASTPKSPENKATSSSSPSPLNSYCGSHSEDIPSSSYTPAPEKSDFSDDENLKFVDSIPESVAPRISFSFPVPRLSFTKASVSTSSLNSKLRSCDVFIGYHGQNPNLIRYCKWLKSELEVQGIACFLADRARYADTQSHEIADRVICSVSFGIVVISTSSLYNHFSMEEVRFFTQKKNLIPMFFDTQQPAMEVAECRSDVKQCREAIEGMIKYHEFKLEAKDGDWRSCISKATGILRSKLGRKSINSKEIEHEVIELPFPRNKKFVGRDKEIMEIEAAFFSNGELSGYSEGVADEGTASETQFETVRSRNSIKKLKYKKSRSVICISGCPDVGKTELALEFAYRYSHRYKMVLWVGGEARYLRQNILNLSINLCSDVSADPEKERGKIRNFEEQEYEAFKRIKRELFRDMPYLIIIDHLETENEWWEGKDLLDLIPRTTGGTHVLFTTRLSKVMNFDVMHLETLPFPDAMMLIRGIRRNKEYTDEEYEWLKKIEEKLGSSTFGLSVVDSLLTELAISPSALFEVVQQFSFEDVSDCSSFSSASDKQLCRNNPFLMKILAFCFSILDKTSQKNDFLASKMFLVGAWFSPSPISANLLVTAAKHIPATGNRLKKWSKWSNCLRPETSENKVKRTEPQYLSFFCCGCPLVTRTWKSEEEYALLLVKLGLARRVICQNQTGLWIQFHPISRMFARTREEQPAITQATVFAIMKIGKPLLNSDHLWASAFLVFGFKSEPPLVQLKAMDMVLFIKKTAIPLAIATFTTFSRCNSALELLKVSTSVLEDVEKSFVSQIQDWRHGSLCWSKKLQQSNQKVDEYAWEEVTMLKATLLETRAKLLLRGGYFDSAEELCRTCISIRTVMLGHNHAHTLAAQETLAKLVRLRSKI
ncbi:hypothetical protein SOVF_071740 [Spinacia oleracea]|uniref:TIR domain-containing protein n=1 Tax=Spinacia oleracea TaxID=3562 RepID=A0A9R0I411_SPIOL|nr:uncharacterized protein LOC110782112 [Spinacia oleracea]KNA18327.1 hypothetical protein SOVF_071740 [Spinacia oleracea]